MRTYDLGEFADFILVNPDKYKDRVVRVDDIISYIEKEYQKHPFMRTKGILKNLVDEFSESSSEDNRVMKSKKIDAQQSGRDTLIHYHENNSIGNCPCGAGLFSASSGSWKNVTCPDCLKFKRVE